MNYSFDIEVLCNSLLPTFLRFSVRLKKILRAVTTPLKTLYLNFLHEGDVMLSEARMTAQAGNLEWMLNSKFDSEKRRIKITHVQDYVIHLNNTRFIVLNNENPVILRNNTASEVDFFVNIPFDFAQNYQVTLMQSKPLVLSSANPITLHDINKINTIDFIKANVSKYKLAGKTFQVNL
ncbi:hypothetical protein [uncultured Microscilla sp.]|uniref:hypothetical protein n=1 Tax=uncultured Microscilla sp. TaxID=432653 RepID=UPI00262989BC|nr:hypothetical protein [uncultured Microscilla sp.]